MLKAIERPLIALSILTLLAGYLFFYQLGSLALTDPDETFYAQTAKEMLRHDEWTTPYLYGKPQFEKPVFFYWLVQASYRIFGINEFAARFPSAVMGLLGLFAVYFLGAILFSRRAGFLAAVMLGSCVEYIILSRACVTDMTLFTCMLAGVAFFYYGYLKEKGYGYLLAAAAFAFATLTKGPVFIVLPLGVLVLHLIVGRNLAIIRRMPIIPSVLVFLAVALPWYLIAYKLHGSAFIDEFFGFHNVTRFVQSEHKIGSQVYYNIPILFGGFFPWSVFLPVGLWRVWRMRRSPNAAEKNGAIFILLWLAVFFFFFTASSTKLPTYIFPCFISIALAVAVFWDSFLDEKRRPALVRGMALSFGLLILVVAAGVIAGPAYVWAEERPLFGGIVLAAALLAYAVALGALAFRRGYFGWAVGFIIFGVALFLYPLNVLVIPEIERYETSKPLAQRLVSSYLAGDAVLGSESHFRAGLAFYTDRFPVNLDRHHDLVAFMGAPERRWCVLKEKNHRELYELDTKPYHTKPSYAVYQIGKRVIITNVLPEDGKYLLKRERTDQR